MTVSDEDVQVVTEQLGRPARGVVEVAHRCPCGLPDVVATAPLIDDGTPFPTVFYLTCPRARAAVSTLESQGVMARFNDELNEDAELAAHFRAAHQQYLAARQDVAAEAGVDVPPALDGISAGGMPDRVKCLHVLVAHALAAGPGVNPLGDRTLELLRAGGADDGVTEGGHEGGTDAQGSTRRGVDPWRCDVPCVIGAH